MFKNFSFLQSRGKLKLLFLGSHGLRSHLSALRWASSRLRKTEDNLTKEQRKLAGEIYTHTRVLTTALNSMLLIGRLEEKDYKGRSEDISLTEALQSLTQDAEYQEMEWVISCGEAIRLRCDANLLRAMLVNLFTLSMEATQKPKKVFVNAHRENDKAYVRFYAVWELPLLAAPLAEEGPVRNRLLGGTPGLMLSLAAELASYIGGTVELEEIATEEDDLILDGTVERGPNAAGEYRIAVSLPSA